SSVKAPSRRGDRLPTARPANGPLLPGLDFVTCDREGTQLLELPRPDGAGLVSVPPLIWIVPDDQGARVLRQAPESRLMIPRGSRPRKPLNDPADLFGRLHWGKSPETDSPTQSRRNTTGNSSDSDLSCASVLSLDRRPDALT